MAADPAMCGPTGPHLPVSLLCLEATIDVCLDAQKLLLYVVRHAHGPQDSQPLQSLLVLNNVNYIDILAWTVPDIDVDPLTSLTATVPPRVALSFTSTNWFTDGTRMETIDAALTALPLDGLVTLNTRCPLTRCSERLWLRNWPLLRRVRLTPELVFDFLDCLMADEGESGAPLFPSLKELVLVDSILFDYLTLDLCDALMKRVEQGVPLELLDLRTCWLNRDYPAAVQLLSEIVVNVQGPEETDYSRAQIMSMWDRLTCGPFVGHEGLEDANKLDADNEDEDQDEDDERWTTGM